ncbi:MAG TPA: condensation domain-containing protein, partial [Gammaproteobacteria bacterium]
MSVTELLKTLSDKKIRLGLKDGRLSYEAPKGALTDELLEQIKCNKSELLSRLQQHASTQHAADAMQIVPVPRDKDDLPLSFSQRRLWLIDQYAQEDTSYNMPSALRLRGSLDVEALRRSFETL